MTKRPPVDVGVSVRARLTRLARERGEDVQLLWPYYPQSNAKIERMHRTLKSESIRRHRPRSKDEAEKVIRDFVRH